MIWNNSDFTYIPKYYEYSTQHFADFISTLCGFSHDPEIKNFIFVTSSYAFFLICLFKIHRNSHMSYSKDIKEVLDLLLEKSEKGSLEAVYIELQHGRFSNYKQVVNFANEERLRRLTYFFEKNYLVDYYTTDWENTANLDILEVSEAMRDLLEESFS